MKAGDVIVIGAVGVGIYLAYKLVTGLKSIPSAVAAGASQASSGVADVLESIFPHAIAAPAFSAYGTVSSIMLGDGSEITPDKVSASAGLFTDVDNVVKIQFFYGGKTYRTTTAQPDSTGTLYAASTTG
jgi:hypothetical protein